jgi:Fic/DOC family
MRGGSGLGVVGERELLELRRIALVIDAQHRVVDATLVRPARWRGTMRRQARGQRDDAEQLRYKRAYDAAVSHAAAGRPPVFGVDQLYYLHADAVGGDEFRSTRIRVGGFRYFTEPCDIKAAVERLLSEVAVSSEPPTLVATWLHLSLMDIHPFTDGNGRTARLAGAVVLATAGYRSTLVTSLEEVTAVHNLRYIYLLHLYSCGVITKGRCLLGLLQQLQTHSHYAAWFRRREQIMRDRLTASVASGDVDAAMVDFDFSDRRLGTSATRDLVVAGIEPLRSWFRKASAAERLVLAHQVMRLRVEENESGVV